jgi:hypothetical protein
VLTGARKTYSIKAPKASHKALVELVHGKQPRIDSARWLASGFGSHFSLAADQGRLAGGLATAPNPQSLSYSQGLTRYCIPAKSGLSYRRNLGNSCFY